MHTTSELMAWILGEKKKEQNQYIIDTTNYKWEKFKISKTRDEKGDVTMDSTKINKCNH